MTGREERKRKIEDQIKEMIKGKSNLYEDYVTYCLAENKQPTTIKLYVATVISFMESAKNDCTMNSVAKILPLDIARYLTQIKKNEKTGESTSTSYRATAFSALKNFFDFLKINKIIKENPMDGMKRPKVTDEKKEVYLTGDQMKKVMDTVKFGTSATGKSKTHEENLRTRDVAVMAMLFELGIRCSALTTIDLGNLDFKNKRIIYKDKGEKTFNKPLSDNLIARLKDWLVDRKKMNPKTNALFVSEKKGRCCYGTIRNIVRKYTEEATGNALSVHKTRHSAISYFHEINGHDIGHTARFAGHSNIAITNLYVHRDYAEKDIELSAKMGNVI